jgi:precorrin-4/cobalt-precorrin-4 C11-methyltransferase
MDKSKTQNLKSKIDNPVLFVGAGPGDPELITVKGQKALQEADLVIYAGSLVPKALLNWTRPGTKTISSAAMHLDEIVKKMETAHAEGQRVVRLHTGDPSLYGAIFEQMTALQERSIPYAVIPGVTAAFAAAAALGIEYTLPEISQTLILTRMAGRTPVPQLENLASLARHQTSMAIYLSISLVDEAAEILMDAYGADSVCVVAYCVSQPDEKIISARLKDLAQTVKVEKITRSALIIVGKVLDIDHTRLKHRSKLYQKGFKHGYRK